jgi:hypothetical protein
MLVRKIPLLGVICAMLMLGACSSTGFRGFVWDDTVPPEQSATVFFWCYSPTSYNGVDVNPKDFRHYVRLPAGTSEFVGDVKWSGNTRQTVRMNLLTETFEKKDTVFSCNLEGGQEYMAVVTYTYDEETKMRHWGIGLYREIKSFVGDTPPRERLVAFILFDPPVLSSN